jgi:hypothetical protein
MSDPSEKNIKELEFWRPQMLKQEFQFRGWSAELIEKVFAFASFYCSDVKSCRQLAELIDLARKVEKH